jgi:hypothetical protein
MTVSRRVKLSHSMNWQIKNGRKLRILYKLRLHQLWVGLHLLFALFGVVLT